MKFSLIVVALWLLSSTTLAAEPVAIAVHGGAGTILPENLTAADEKAIRHALAKALEAGHQLLEAGSSAEDAVVAAITILEDSPHFNAGHGAVFTHEGNHELDASIMRGRDRNAGAVSGVRNVRNPILLAQRVMTESRHVILSGSGADEFALQQSLDVVPNQYFSTPRRRAQLEQAKARTSARIPLPQSFQFGTVGAVALDRNGNLAAGTSTGGMTNKRFGRIGDSPIVGAGTYADNETCAVSATGHGEYFIRAVVAHDIAAEMRYAGKSVRTAADSVINQKLVEFGGSGGVIAIDATGQIAMPHNTPGMYRGSITPDGQLTTAIYADETAK